jgi:hypothetical protein
MPLNPERYIHDRYTNTHYVTNEQMELAMPNEFHVDIYYIPTKFHFTDYWAGQAYLANEGKVALGRGIIVGVEDTDENVTITMDGGGRLPLSRSVEAHDFRDAKYTRILVADSNYDTGSPADYHNKVAQDVFPIGFNRYNAFENVKDRFSGGNIAVYQNSQILLPYVARSVAADLQVGCVTDAAGVGGDNSLQAGDFVMVGGSHDGTDIVDLAGKYRKAISTETNPKWIVGQVWEVQRAIPLKGWLEKVALGFGDYARASTFYTDPTTTASTTDYGPWTAGQNPTLYTLPGINLPDRGRGIYTMTDGATVSISLTETHTVTAAEDTADALTHQLTFTRYYDNGTYIGEITTTSFEAANDQGGTGGGGSDSTPACTVDAAGLVTVTDAGTGKVVEDDVLTFTVTAKAILAGSPVSYQNVQADMGETGSGTRTAATGLALIQCKF